MAAKPDLIILQGYFTDEQGYESIDEFKKKADGDWGINASRFNSPIPDEPSHT